ncbi:conserved hypothetical protein [Rhizobium johnstonii 3841]|uniref:Uncharacterized protein n=2 Tax=Rhizobium TaxID=379 RepID=Q1M3G6_RHIJ3|nr:conserved hypothetical protein [Rhizobium johnstonii 3841]
MTSCRGQSPVHSAHVGDEVEVHYRWHPYFGQKVSVRRVEERATGRFLKVLGPTGVVIAISGWMIDPVVCSGMTMGTARVDLAALIELNRLVSGGAKAALFRGEHRITQEEDDEIPQHAGAGVGPAARPDIQNPHARRTERQGSQEGDINTGLPADAGGRSGRRGAQR